MHTRRDDHDSRAAHKAGVCEPGGVLRRESLVEEAAAAGPIYLMGLGAAGWTIPSISTAFLNTRGAVPGDHHALGRLVSAPSLARVACSLAAASVIALLLVAAERGSVGATPSSLVGKSAAVGMARSHATLASVGAVQARPA